MSMLDWFRSKAAPQSTELHVATAGRAQLNVGPGSDPHSVKGEHLVRRYGFWVQRCISLNAQAAACVPFKLMRISRRERARQFMLQHGTYRALDARTKHYLRGNASLKPSVQMQRAVRGNMDDMVEVTEHPVLDLLDKVNDWTDGYAFREALFSDFQIHGRAFTLLVGPDVPDELWRMLPHRTRVLRDAENFVGGFEYGQAPDEVRYGADDVLWLRQYDPEDPWGGVGPLEAWLKTIDAADAIAAFQLNLMRRMGAPDWVVVSERPMDEPQKRAFRREWQRLFGSLGMRRDNVGFLSNATLEKLTQSPKELEFNLSEDQKRDQIGQAFGVPKAILDISEIRANSREAKQQHMEATVWPMVQRWEDMLNAKLLPLYGDGLVLMHESPVPDDVDETIKLRSSMLQSGYSVNEVRIHEGEEPLPDAEADIPMVASGLVPLGVAAMDPADLEPEEPEMVEEEPTEMVVTEGAQPETVLQGQQLAQALAIVQAVVDDKIPIDAARGMLSVLFNLDADQVEAVLAGVEGFEKPEPVMPPGLPGDAPAEAGPPPPAPSPEGEEGQRQLDHGPMAVAAALLIGKELGKEQLKLPDVNVAIRLEPDINVHHPDVFVEVPELKAPDIHVPAPVVNIEPPEVQVTVESPDIEVKAPEVKVDVAAPEVKVEAPIVNVEPPEVKVLAPVEVNLLDADD